MKYKHIFKLCFCVFLVFVLALPAMAQNAQTFKAKIVDTNDEPIIGASVKIVGASTGTITDLNGNFTLPVSANSKVEISFIGYISQIISDFKNTRIVLKEDLMQLDEVVVVGYGTQKKAHLTGAIATVPINEITDLSTGSLASSLSGLVNGLSVSGGEGRPGETARLTVRQNNVASSYSTVSGYVPETSPLYVIDGYISDETAFNNLDATMVESISVLKDAAASVYGTRSANGVILVTTKRGEMGKPKISYSGQFGMTDEVSRAKMLSAYEYGKLWNAVRTANPKNPWDSKTDLFQADELEAMKSLNYDLLDKEWKAAFTQKHSINVGGGVERANYFGGISYYTQDGNLGKIDYERWNYRAGVDLKITDWIKTSLQLSGDYGDQRKAYSKIGGESSETDYNTLLTHPRYIPEYVNGYPIAAYGVTNSYINDSQYYHYDVVQNLDNYSKSKSQNMTINSSVEYDLGWNKWLKGLKLKFSYSKSIHTSKGNQYATDYTLYSLSERAGSGGHLYTGSDLNLNADNFQAITVSNGNFLRRTTSQRDNYQMNFVVSYGRKFGQHDVGGLFTIERSESEYEDLDGSVTSPYTFTNGQSSSATGTQTTAFTRTESGSLSYVGRANYAYADTYLLEFLIRSDASTKFAPENYWGTFYSLSGGWVASRESWFKEYLKGIDYLKIRGSIGLTGRDNIKAWSWLKSYTLQKDKGPIFGTNGESVASGTHIGIPDQTPNRDAHWDKSYKANFGLDLNTLNNRVTINVDGYYEWNRDIFVTRSGGVPWTIGARPSAENYGSIDSWGMELSLGWRDKIGKDFKYSIRVNTGYNDNKVIKMPWQNPIAIDQVHPGQRSDRGQWGMECIGMFRSYQEIEEYFDKYNITNYLGKSKEDIHPGMLIYRDIRGPINSDGTYNGPDGKINKNEDIVQISNRNNPYGLTMNLKADWKNLSFSAQLSANWGGYSFISSNARKISSLTSSASGYNVMQFVNLPAFWADNMFVYEDIYDASGNLVVEANRNAKYPNLYYTENNETSTFWRVSGARATLRNITVAYALPKKLVSKMGIGSCRLNLTGQNLLSLYNPYPDNYIDPMCGYGSYPTLRKFTLGVNISF